ncbi:hypothetical protein CYLTODRAFT_362083 [Cylindrobasidium torrendii FP15055 ss-10]|uniref:Methyltransferase-domain-containing protein n=1 Tax=Cylindrobasidium torrendii FP15055 ss-10 TaxID=1314674 RepID=A0A0D7AUY3_9AGAR|nr:hypothetical protein CYLTODRAFT_362083 [Cylindrobasidium torrendii FP15055 ss-10]
MAHTPNFPPGLEIFPSSSEQLIETNGLFSSDSQTAAIQKYGIAGRIWEAAYVLLTYVNPSNTWEFDPPFYVDNETGHPMRIRGIELGSGTGIVAHALRSAQPAPEILVATDLPEVCPLLEANLHPDASLIVRPLSWGNRIEAMNVLEESFAHKGLSDVICSDLVYFPELLSPLLRTLLHLTDAFPLTRVTISYRIRSLSKEAPFWSAFGLWFDFAPVLYRTGPKDEWTRFGETFDDPTYVFVARRKPESMCWRLPMADRDLLAGVGAGGTDAHKGDDTFDTLLMMALGN